MLDYLEVCDDKNGIISIAKTFSCQLIPDFNRIMEKNIHQVMDENKMHEDFVIFFARMNYNETFRKQSNIRWFCNVFEKQNGYALDKKFFDAMFNHSSSRGGRRITNELTTSEQPKQIPDTNFKNDEDDGSDIDEPITGIFGDDDGW